jgi:hypothetical protein
MEMLRAALKDKFSLEESRHFLLLLPCDRDLLDLVPSIAEQCRSALLDALPGVARFDSPGKHIVVSFADSEQYYQYLSAFYPEGHHGASAGMHLRDGYPHIAMYGRGLALLEGTLSHELTHAALCHLTLPPWIEEGLAEVFTRDTVGPEPFVVNADTARRHKRFWGKRGLKHFWSGDGFLQPGKIQELCYQLAEIIMRNLIEDHRPRWFGWDRDGQRSFLDFLRCADASDFGEGAAKEHLGLSIGDLAARFLGPGPWLPD